MFMFKVSLTIESEILSPHWSLYKPNGNKDQILRIAKESSTPCQLPKHEDLTLWKWAPVSFMKTLKFMEIKVKHIYWRYIHYPQGKNSIMKLFTSLAGILVDQGPVSRKSRNFSEGIILFVSSKRRCSVTWNLF